MPWPALIVLSIVVVGSIGFIAYQVRELRRRNRNLKHWEKGEPLEGGADDWD